MFEIEEAIKNKKPPLVFINLEPITGENLFHWVVAVGMDEKNIYINDPDMTDPNCQIKRKNYPIKKEIFKKATTTNKYNRTFFPLSLLNLPPNIVLVYR
jgi:hypothetical protein